MHSTSPFVRTWEKGVAFLRNGCKVSAKHCSYSLFLLTVPHIDAFQLDKKFWVEQSKSEDGSSESHAEFSIAPTVLWKTASISAAFPTNCLQRNKPQPLFSSFRCLAGLRSQRPDRGLPRAGVASAVPEQLARCRSAWAAGLLFKVMEFCGLESSLHPGRNQPPHFCQMMKILSEKEC